MMNALLPLSDLNSEVLQHNMFIDVYHQATTDDSLSAKSYAIEQW